MQAILSGILITGQRVIFARRACQRDCLLAPWRRYARWWGVAGAAVAIVGAPTVACMVALTAALTVEKMRPSLGRLTSRLAAHTREARARAELCGER